MLIYTVVYTEPSDRKYLVLSVQTIMLPFLSSVESQKMSNPGKKSRFSIFRVSYWHIYKEQMHGLTSDIIGKGWHFFLKKQKNKQTGKKTIILSVPLGKELHNTDGVWKEVSVGKEDQSVLQYKHQKRVRREYFSVSLLTNTHDHPVSCAKKGGRVKTRTQTRRSASSPAWPPPAGWPARAQRWRGCSAACCPSPPGADFAGTLCWGQWAAAPGPGYTAVAAWWGCPGGSEGEEKPLRTRAGATGKQSRQESATQEVRKPHYHHRKNNGGQLDH